MTNHGVDFLAREKCTKSAIGAQNTPRFAQSGGAEIP